MNNFLTLSFAVLFVLFISQLHADEFSPEVRHFGADTNGKGYKYGYMNVKPNVDHYLDVQPIKQVIVNKTEECIIGCIREMDCCSMNIQEESVGGTTTKNCSLLSTDRYRSYEKFVVKPQVSHFEIVVS